MSEPMKIFEASFDPETKQIKVSIYTTHLPYVTFAQKLLDLEVTDKMLENQMQVRTGNIITPNMGLDIK